MGIKDNLIKATEVFEVSKVLNEAESMGIDDIAKKLNTSKQNIYRALSVAMGKMYKQVKKEFKATPAEAIKLLMSYLDADASEVMAYLDKDSRSEVEQYVKQSGAN